MDTKTTTFRDAFGGQLAHTENGAVSLATTQPLFADEKVHGRTAFFFKAVRSLLSDEPQLFKYLKEADGEDALDALRLVFHLRDCRGTGKGERDLFRRCVKWYRSNGKGNYLTHNLKHVAHFGRWDDVLECPGGHEFVARQLLDDFDKIEKANTGDTKEDEKTGDTKEDAKDGDDKKSARAMSISLAAKWVPSAGSKTKKSQGKHLALLGAMNDILSREGRTVLGRPNLREKEYRKIVSALREHLRLVERMMCADRWKEIDFNAVPSGAMHLYGKASVSGAKGKKRKLPDGLPVKGAFFRHRPEEFEAYRKALKTGKTEDGKVVKVNAAQLFPYQVVNSYFHNHYDPASASDDLVEAQWKVLEENVRAKRHSPSGCLFVVDVSGSMTSPTSGDSTVRCLDVAMSLGLLGARTSVGAFKDMVISFSDKPSFFEVNQPTLRDALVAMRGMDWGMTTNLQAVFDLVLSHAQRCKVPDSEMPRCVVILSDMEFNTCCNSNTSTNYETIRSKYAASGYSQPALAFWNLRSSSTNQQFPVRADESGTLLLSGFSPALFEALAEGDFKQLNPFQMIRKVIDSPVYSGIALPPSSVTSAEMPVEDEEFTFGGAPPAPDDMEWEPPHQWSAPAAPTGWDQH